MASPARPPLDSPPPLPPGLRGGAPPAPAGVGQLAPPGGAPGGEGTQTAQAVIERAMIAERVLTSMVDILPALAPVMDTILGQLRAGVVRALQAGQGSPAGAPVPPAMMSGMPGAPMGM